MDNTQLHEIWKSYDANLEKVLSINKEIAIDLTRNKLNNQIGRLYLPKWSAVLIGLPYTIALILIATIAFFNKAYFVALGFGVIALIMSIIMINYFYHLYLISKVRSNENILSTQQQLSNLRISSFNCLNLSVLQLPFWSICWISIEALKENPFTYGIVNLLIFLFLAYISYWLLQKMSYKNKKSKIRDFFLSGSEWEPILRSTDLLEQIKEYEK